MNRSGTLLVLALISLLVLTACAAQSPDAVDESSPPTVVAEVEATAASVDSTETAAPPTATDVPPTETAVPPTATSDPTATTESAAETEDEAPPTPTAEPTLTPNPDVLASNCLNCHSNQQLLIDLAKPEEAPEESESSGVG